MMQTGSLFLEHGIMPFGGAWVDQPESWVNAYYNWLSWLNRKRKEYKGEDSANGDAFEKILGVSDGDEAGNWQDAFGEH